MPEYETQFTHEHMYAPEDDGFYEGYDPCAGVDDYLACRENLENNREEIWCFCDDIESSDDPELCAKVCEEND